MLKTRGLQLIICLFFMALPCSSNRKYDIESECYKLYHEDLHSVLQRFRRTPEYSRIVEDQFNQFRTTTFNIMKVNTFQYFTSKMAAKISEMFANQSSPGDTSQQEQHQQHENDAQNDEMTEVPPPDLENDEMTEVPPPNDEKVPETDENGEEVTVSQENGENIPENGGSGDAEENHTKDPEIVNSEVDNDVKEPILNTEVRENKGKKHAIRENPDSFAFQDTLSYTKRNPVGRLDSYHKLGSALKVSQRNSMKDLGFQYAGHYIDELIKHVRGNLKDIAVEPRHDTTDAYYMRQGAKYININISKTNQNKITKKHENMTKKFDRLNDKTTKKYYWNKKEDGRMTKVNVNITPKNNKSTKKIDKATKKAYTITKKDPIAIKKADKTTKKYQNTVKIADMTTKKDQKTIKKDQKSTKKVSIITNGNDVKNTKINATTTKGNDKMKGTISTRTSKVNLYRLVTALDWQ